MSLLSFVRTPDVARRLAPYRPNVRRVHTGMRVPPGGNPQLVGTAFDYLLRFELQRRAPHAVHGEWVAEAVASLISRPGSTPGTWVTRDFLWDDYGGRCMPPDEVARRIAGVCRSARACVSDYLNDPNPPPERQQALAAWAVRLAKIDGVFRRGELDPTFEEAPAGMVDELVALLGVVPYSHLVHPDRMLLNPDFGEASLLVGGADADLITGDMLVDIKTTRTAVVSGEYLDQLFGYFLLARRAGLPQINKVGVYLSRFGHLRTGETDAWTRRPDFAATESWFFERAAQAFGRREPAPLVG